MFVSSQLHGHGTLLERLKKAFIAGRLPHGILFQGSFGVGKATLAAHLASFILDVPLTHMLSHGAIRWLAPTFKEKAGRMVRAQDILKDEVTDTLSFVYETNLWSSWRCVIIDATDNLTTHSANALLKALEEPPARTVFMLITHGHVLPTLRSRCLPITCAPLSVTAVSAVLAEDKVFMGKPETLDAYPPLLPLTVDASVDYLLDKGSAGLVYRLVAHKELYDLCRKLMSCSDALPVIQDIDRYCKNHNDGLWACENMLLSLLRQSINDQKSDPYLTSHIYFSLQDIFCTHKRLNMDQLQTLIQAFELISQPSILNSQP
jgi:hypothetical protein